MTIRSRPAIRVLPSGNVRLAGREPAIEGLDA